MIAKKIAKAIGIGIVADIIVADILKEKKELEYLTNLKRKEKIINRQIGKLKEEKEHDERRI